MALTQVAAADNGSVVLYADVSSTGVVLTATLVNDSPHPVEVHYINGTTVLFDGIYAPGTHVAPTLAKTKQFTHATATATRASLTVRPA